MANPRCFFDVTIGGADAGRIVMEVRRTYQAIFEGFVLTFLRCESKGEKGFYGAGHLLKLPKGLW